MIRPQKHELDARESKIKYLATILENGRCGPRGILVDIYLSKLAQNICVYQSTKFGAFITKF